MNWLGAVLAATMDDPVPARSKQRDASFPPVGYGYE